MEVKIGNKSFQINPDVHVQYWNYIAEGKWEKETFRIIDAFTKETSTLLDLGAWAGPISLYAASQCKQVIAFEPDPAVFYQLEQNVKLNPKLSHKIKCFPYALAEESAKHRLFARKKYGESSTSLLQRSRDKLSDEICESISLENFILQEKISRIDFIKMDIEGYEFKVLPQLKPALEKLNFPSLLISFHRDHLLENILVQKHQNKWLNKFLFKLHKWGLYTSYKKLINERIIASLTSLKDYKYLYDESGSSFNLSLFMGKPELIKNQALLFSMKKWKGHA